MRTLEVLEAIHTLRAVRHFKPNAVEDEKIRTILDAAIRAPSGGNTQPWEFVVVTDPQLKQGIKQPIAEAWRALMKSPRIQALPPKVKAIYEEATELVEATEKVPALILACIDLNRASRSEEARYASIYPAVQNLMLAAHELGLGTCLTTHGSTPTRGEDEVKRVLGIPRDVKVACVIYLGYPARKLTPPKRRPIREVTHYNKW